MSLFGDICSIFGEDSSVAKLQDYEKGAFLAKMASL